MVKPLLRRSPNNTSKTKPSSSSSFDVSDDQENSPPNHHAAPPSKFPTSVRAIPEDRKALLQKWKVRAAERKARIEETTPAADWLDGSNESDAVKPATRIPLKERIEQMRSRHAELAERYAKTRAEALTPAFSPKTRLEEVRTRMRARVGTLSSTTSPSPSNGSESFSLCSTSPGLHGSSPGAQGVSELSRRLAVLNARKQKRTGMESHLETKSTEPISSNIIEDAKTKIRKPGLFPGDPAALGDPTFWCNTPLSSAELQRKASVRKWFAAILIQRVFRGWTAREEVRE